VCNKEEIKRIMTSAELDTAVSAAVCKALEAGLDKADVAAVLSRIVELLEADS
jgi:hypothetical protein